MPPQFLDHLVDHLWQNRQTQPGAVRQSGRGAPGAVQFPQPPSGNYGTTVDLAQPSYQREGNDRDLDDLLRELHEGQVAALFVHQCNPVHDLPAGTALAEDLQACAAVRQLGAAAGRNRRAWPTSFARSPITWNLERCGTGQRVVSLSSRSSHPLGETRSLLESLAAWMGTAAAPPTTCCADHWEHGGVTRAAELHKVAFQDLLGQRLPRRLRPGPAPAIKLDSLSTPTQSVPCPRPVDRRRGTFSVSCMPRWACPTPAMPTIPGCRSCRTRSARSPGTITPACRPRRRRAGRGGRRRGPPGSGRRVRGRAGAAGLRAAGTARSGGGRGPGLRQRLSQRFADIGPPWLEARPTVGADGLVGRMPLPSDLGRRQSPLHTRRRASDQRPAGSTPWPRPRSY